MTAKAAQRLVLELRAEGLYAPELDLFLDPAAPVARAFVSHAHVAPFSRDGARSGVLFASRLTLALLEHRLGRSLDDARALDEAPVDVPVDRGHARLSVAPAGHMLGASQLVVDHPSGRLVYTGDYGPGPSRTHAVAAPVACDDLVLESTFALPIYRFPDAAREMDRLVQFCRQTLADGLTPVLLALALGTAQEIAAELVAAGIPVAALAAVHRSCEAYEKLGVSMGISDGAIVRFEEEGPPAKGRVVIAPLNAPKATRAVRKARVALASGASLVDAVVDQHRADAAFAIADHAGYDELVSLARETGASCVTTTAGDASMLALLLERRGIAARPLARPPMDDGFVS